MKKVKANNILFGDTNMLPTYQEKEGNVEYKIQAVIP